MDNLVVVQQVGHLEVPMNDPPAVEVLDRLQQLEHDALDLRSAPKSAHKGGVGRKQGDSSTKSSSTAAAAETTTETTNSQQQNSTPNNKGEMRPQARTGYRSLINQRPDLGHSPTQAPASANAHGSGAVAGTSYSSITDY